MSASAPTPAVGPNVLTTELEKYPAFEDSDIQVLEGKTLSKSNGWWQAVLLIKTYGKCQVKTYLWQERIDKTTGQSSWKRKQSWTVNSYNWNELKKTIDEFL